MARVLIVFLIFSSICASAQKTSPAPTFRGQKLVFSETVNSHAASSGIYAFGFTSDEAFRLGIFELSDDAVFVTEISVGDEVQALMQVSQIKLLGFLLGIQAGAQVRTARYSERDNWYMGANIARVLMNRDGWQVSTSTGADYRFSTLLEEKPTSSVDPFVDIRASKTLWLFESKRMVQTSPKKVENHFYASEVRLHGGLVYRNERLTALIGISIPFKQKRRIDRYKLAKSQ